MLDWAGALLRALLDSTLRMILVGCGVALILYLFRVRSSSLQHAAWSVALCVMLVMPVLPHWIPSVSLPVRPPVLPVQTLTTMVSSPSIAPAPPLIQQTSTVPEPTVIAQPMSSPPSGVPLVPLTAVAIYFVGVAYFATRLFTGFRFARKLLRTGRKVDIPEVNSVSESEYVASPVTVGVLRPQIILPTTWRSWSEERVRAILAHEKTHVQRRDNLVTFLAQTNCALFWFNPLAWWLKNKLAITAECACDDAAVEAIGAPKAYAEILLDVAKAVSLNRRRLAWQGIGVHGNGFLETRIDRILAAKHLDRVSKLRKRLILTATAVLIFAVVACRDQSAPVFGLTEIKDFKAEETRAAMTWAAEIARQREQASKWVEQQQSLKGVQSMSPEQAERLESELRKSPDDLGAREKLIYYYQGAERIDGRRLHILWMIEHHPDHQLLGSSVARINPDPQGALSDPAGYAMGKALWQAHTSRSDAGVAMLSNAAFFFEVNDKELAEKLLLRAQAMQPDKRWSNRLGRLYFLALMGATDVTIFPTFDETRTTGVAMVRKSDAEAKNKFAQSVRQTLESTKDSQMLTFVGLYLTGTVPDKFAPDRMVQAKAYLERAVQLDPQTIDARKALLRIRSRSANERMRELVMKVPREKRYEAVGALSTADRFVVARELAIYSYTEGNSMDVLDPEGAQAARERAKKYSEDLLKLASQLTKDEGYSGALFIGDLVAGLVAARNGDSETAVKYLRHASTIPPSEEMAYLPPFVPYDRLCTILAGSGYRGDVIAFLEHFAQINMSDRDYILRQAAGFRR